MNEAEAAWDRARSDLQHPDNRTQPHRQPGVYLNSSLVGVASTSEAVAMGTTDADYLARFEALVQLQKPASKPWAPVTDYSFEARKAIEGIHPQLIKDVFRARKIVDVGCGRNAILIRLLREVGAAADHVCGFDTEAGDAAACRADILDRDSFREWLMEWHDLVICRECLEHLTVLQIRQAVTNLCALSSTYVYVTTRFAKAAQHLLDVDTSDDLDPTHITMLNQNLLRLLFVLEGFRRRADLEEKMDWQKKGRVLVYERVS